jgi:PAS domain S-box-containing protein
MTLFKLKRLFRYYYLAIIAFLLLFLLTQIAYHETRRRTEQRQAALFTDQTDQLRADIERRLHHYVQILKGTQGLFVASTEVSRKDWKRYVETIDVNQNYPGIQGIGFAQYIRPEALHRHLSQVRAEGFPHYRVMPENARAEYTPITYLEPFDERNQRAFGFDMFSEPIRRKAMQKARDTNQPVISGKVKLVQETGTDVQSGFLLYLPVYETETPPATVYERRQKLLGYVFSPFRAKDLMNNVIGSDFEDIDVEVYDGDTVNRQSLLFDKDGVLTYFQPRPANRYSRLIPLSIYGHTWNIYTSSLPSFNSSSDLDLAHLILGGGLVISLLLCVVLWNLANGQKNADLRQTITDNATAALFMIDARGYCTFMNPAAHEMTGYTFEEIRQQPLQQMIHSWPAQQERPDVASSWPLHPVLRHQREIRGHEALFNRKDGSRFHVTCAARPIYENRSPVSILMEVRDITEEKGIRQEMLESVERQKLILEAMPQIAWTATPTGEITYYNQRWYDYTGLPREPISTESWNAVRHPDEADISLQMLLQDANNREVEGAKMQFRRAADGTYRWHLVRATPIKKEDGQMLLWIGTCTDIHDEMLREAFLQDYNYKLADINQELQQKNAELVRINTDLDNFVYTASHDLKSPVVNIEGFITVLSKKYAQREETPETKMLHMIGEAARKLKCTINDLTEITKVQKNQEQSPALLFFDEIVEDVRQDLHMLIEQSGGTITTCFEIKSVEYARKNLRSVIYNLLSNAIKYRSPERPLRVEMTTRETPEYILFQIRDNGLGINERQKSKLFTMFKRFHAHVEGTGIGLYIVKRIIENNQGRIEVESEEGQGTTFRVWFRTMNGE